MEVVFFPYVVMPATCLLFLLRDEILDGINKLERQYRNKKKDNQNE